MTAAATALATPLPDPDLTGWVSWLRERIEPRWRPGEWDGQAWFFVGDPDNDRTIAYWCRTKSCPSISNSAGFCTCCIREFKASELTDKDEFAATHIPNRGKASPGRFQQRCAVERDGVRCADPKYCQQLCQSHYIAWRNDLARNRDLDIDEWMATVPSPRPGGTPTCVVIRCEQEQFRGRRLCTYHHAKHGREAPGEPIDRWAATQTPYLYAHQFSLIPFSPVLRWEMLYFLQQRDIRGGKIDPTIMRMLARALHGAPHLVGADWTQLTALPEYAKSYAVRAHLAEAVRTLRLGYDRMCGIEPTDKLVWDLAVVGTAADATKTTGRRRIVRTNANPVDFSSISQTWLRDLALAWARHADPIQSALRDTVKATALASRALERRPGGGHDATVLELIDMDAVVEGLRAARRVDGEPHSSSYRRGLVTRFFTVLEFGRRTGLMNDVPIGFSRHRSHVIGHDEPNEDEIGKAVPEPVITQLDRHEGEIGVDVPYGKLTAEQVRHMFRTAYVVLRDTGRRPGEVCSLRTNCLEHHDDGYDLVWDNHKSKRHRRRLPIDSETAQAIKDWLPVREQVISAPRSAEYLFPAITTEHALPYLDSSVLSKAVRAWVDAIPEIDSDVPGPDGSPLPFDRSLIYPYAFRHSYAQRHADAGVPVDVLRELMDHKRIDTTMGYYSVSLKRKREAVKTMRKRVVDRTGRSAPISSNTAYEARSVAVPFGNCIEPSNVKAGGKACPIRFQCSGCGFYRPDPSYLLAIEEHINSLRADRETAEAMDADEFVTRNLTDQITAFSQVLTTMREELAAMDSAQRKEIEEASAVLRKSRAAQGRPTLPLTVVNRRTP